MANPIWPATLPNPSINMSGTVRRPLIGTQMDGRHRTRRRWTGRQEEHNVSWVLDETELAAFETFVDTTLEGGSLFFDIDLPLDGAAATVTVRFKNGDFQKAYNAHNHWRISAILEREIAQGVNDPAQTFNPVYFQPEFVITADTVLGDQHKNALLRVQGVTDTVPIVLKVLFGDDPAEFFPFGVQHEGAPGDVIVRMLADGDDGSLVDPIVLGQQLGFHVYEFNDGANYTNDPGGRLDTIKDLNTGITGGPIDLNSHVATDDTNKAFVGGGAIQVRKTGLETFYTTMPWIGGPGPIYAGGQCWLVVVDTAEVNTLVKTVLLWGNQGSTPNRPRFEYGFGNGAWSMTWGGGGTSSAQYNEGTAINGPFGLTRYCFMIYTLGASTRLFVNGQDCLLDASNTDTMLAWETIRFGGDRNNETDTIDLDMDIYELYVAGIDTGMPGAGLSVANALALQEALCVKHGISWLGA